MSGYLARPALIDEYNVIYREYFSPPYPARTTIACQLVVPGMLLQVEAFARRPAPEQNDGQKSFPLRSKAEKDGSHLSQ